MKKTIVLLIFIFSTALVHAYGGVLTTNEKDNFDILSKATWRNKLEVIQFKKVKNTWHLVWDGETYKIHSLNNGVFYIDNPYINDRNYYGYNTETDELWYVEECAEGWCLGDIPFERN